MRPLRLLAAPVLLLALAGCGSGGNTPASPPTGEQATLTSLKDACPQIAEAVLGTSPTAPDQLQALAASLDAISDEGNVKVKNALGSVPVDVRALADDPNDATAARKYAADVAGIARACAVNGSPFPVS